LKLQNENDVKRCRQPWQPYALWLNMALAQLWPQLSAALSAKIGGKVGDILSKISPLGLQLSFKEFDLGTEALSILSAGLAGQVGIQLTRPLCGRSQHLSPLSWPPPPCQTNPAWRPIALQSALATQPLNL
jgi:hypothetical protein